MILSCVDLTSIAASNTASDDVTRSHVEYLVQTYYILVLIL